MTQQTERHDLLIVGGGLNGPTLALAAAQAGLRTALIEAGSPKDQSDLPMVEDGRSYALALSSMRLLRALGLWDQLAPHAQPMNEIKVSDARAGQAPSPLVMEFDHAEIEEGPMGYMVEDRHLRTVLNAAMDAADGLSLHRGSPVVAQTVTAHGAELRCADGTQLTGTLIAGCDGRKSGTCQRAGLRRTGWDYGQTALVATIAHERPHHGVAHQQFLPSGPLAILPLTGNRVSIVWSESDARAAALMTGDDDAFMQALCPVFGDFLGDISLISDRFSYPLGLTVANSFIAPRVVLVGDAAHGMHPIAGQGLNAGLRDVAALRDVLVEARQRGEDFGAPLVLERYQSWRRFDTMSLVAATDAVNRLFSNDNPVLRAVRDLGLGMVNAAAPLRRGFIREAAGLTGTLPTLMR